MGFVTNWDEIYNCIARLARFIKDKAKQRDYIDFISNEIAPPNNYVSLDDVIDRQLNGILYDFSGTISLSDENFEKACEIILYATEELLSRESIQEIFIFLQILDKAMERNILNESWKEEIGEYQYLNSNFKETGIGILPFYHCGWELSRERISRSHDINVFVDNYLLVDLEELRDLNVVHYYLDSSISLNKYQLKVGVSPLWKWKNFDYKEEVKDSKKVINISYNSDYRKETDIIYKTIESASKEQVDILLFPEMHGNVEMKKIIRNKMLAVRYEYPKLIVLPSVWKDGENKASVINRFGIEIFEQGKRTPFIDENNYYENLNPYNGLNVMHIRGFGRIIIMICRDFLEVRVVEKMLDELRPTMVLIPSFSTGYHTFERVKGICEAHECAVVWVNSCAGSREENPIGFVAKAGHSYDSEEDKNVLFFPCCESKIQCEGSCESKGCLYTTTLINPKAMEGEG